MALGEKLASLVKIKIAGTTSHAHFPSGQVLTHPQMVLSVVISSSSWRGWPSFWVWRSSTDIMMEWQACENKSVGQKREELYVYFPLLNQLPKSSTCIFGDLILGKKVDTCRRRWVFTISDSHRLAKILPDLHPSTGIVEGWYTQTMGFPMPFSIGWIPKSIRYVYLTPWRGYSKH